ncbi:alpha-L-fucosidase [Nocardiopsis sp. NPDC006139]|uniref:alpha-L-fucosidase n=1 Tax=Nocardiopsis sp. NPDC006139 TaxID=3154578 RepID=UPI0033B15509
MHESADTGTTGRGDALRHPSWFDEAKLGILVHWGAASIPAYAPVRRSLLPDPVADMGVVERADVPAWWRTDGDAGMYQNALALPGSAVGRHHRERYGDLPYSVFVERLRDEVVPRWDPRPWGELFERSGAGYVVFSAKAEDGFLMWPSEHPHPRGTAWSSPRDVVGELAEEVRGRGMEFGVYYSAWDFSFSQAPVSDLASALAALPRGEDYRDLFLGHWKELVRRYRPCTLWNDYGVSPPGLDLPALFEWYHDRVPHGLVNDRFDIAAQGRGDLHAGYATCEPGVAPPERGRWQAVRPLSGSYFYNAEERDSDHIDPVHLVHVLADVVARGGSLLVNVGPTGAGAVPWSQSRRLLELGAWMDVYGEAVRGTRPWTRVHGTTDEGLQVRYTRTGRHLNAIVLGTPRTADLGLDLLLEPGSEVTALDGSGPLDWRPSPHGTTVRLREAPPEQPAIAVRIGPVDGVSPV